MEKLHFAIKLVPPRVTFAQDMTDDERAIMKTHSIYLRGFMEQGIVLVFGPVLDPTGVYGLGIIAVDDEEQAKTLMANDPATQIAHYEYNRMMAVLPEKQVF
jgi:uncharacterized protein YciI